LQANDDVNLPIAACGQRESAMIAGLMCLLLIYRKICSARALRSACVFIVLFQVGDEVHMPTARVRPRPAMLGRAAARLAAASTSGARERIGKDQPPPLGDDRTQSDIRTDHRHEKTQAIVVMTWAFALCGRRYSKPQPSDP
jgi:hypothetical protein